MLFLPPISWLAAAALFFSTGLASSRCLPSDGKTQVTQLSPAVTNQTATDTVETDTTQLLLTDDALKHLMVFQELLLQEQDVLIAYAQSHQVTVRLPMEGPMVVNGRTGFSKQNITFRVFNIDALAAKYPAVAEAFIHTHLTSKQWREYRRSLAIAVLEDRMYATEQPPTVFAKSLTWKNVLFLRAHQQTIDVMVADGYWLPFHEN